MPINQEETCRGCLRYTDSGLGTTYDFISDGDWQPHKIYFDVTVLEKLLQRSPREIFTETYRNPVFEAMVAQHEIFPEHIDHVDLSKPVFIGDFTFTRKQDGESYSEKFQLSLDGHHRIARCLRERRDVNFVHFTEPEMRLAAHYSMKSLMRTKGILILANEQEIECALEKIGND